MRKKKRGLLLDAALAAAAALLMLSLLYLGSLQMNCRRSSAEYEAIQEKAVRPTETPIGEGEEEDDGFSLDWDYLHTLNPDIVAWIRFPNLGISYPVVQGADNDEYLHTTVEGTYAYAGAIFMDSLCRPDFSSANTVLYGHNMRDRSMFGSLKLLYRDTSLLRKNEYFFIYTEDYTYKYSIFSLGYADPEDENFFFLDGPDEAKQAYINFCMESNMFEMPVKADIEDLIVTLSTCKTDRTDPIRFQVHAVRTETEPVA